MGARVGLLGREELKRPEERFAGLLLAVVLRAHVIVKESGEHSPATQCSRAQPGTCVYRLHAVETLLAQIRVREARRLFLASFRAFRGGAL